MSDNRLHDWDALRGLMMLLGIVIHAGVSFIVYPALDFWPYKFSSTHLFFDVVVTAIHLFRVPVFFIIAGYFMTMQLRKYGQREAIKKRVKRIVIPFFLAMVLVTPWVVFAFDAMHRDSPSLAITDVFYYYSVVLEYTVHFWFLYYLIIFYILHIIFRSLSVKMVSDFGVKSSLFFLLVGQFLILLIFGLDSIHGGYGLLPPVGSVAYFLCYYLLGVWIYDHLSAFVAFSTFSWKKLLWTLFMFANYLLYRDNEDFFRKENYGLFLESLVTIGAALSLVILIFGVFRIAFAKEKRWILHLAKASYFIYIVHLPILVWCLYFLQDSINNPFLLFLILIVFTSLFSYLLYRLKMSVTGFLKR